MVLTEIIVYLCLEEKIVFSDLQTTLVLKYHDIQYSLPL